ncbi:hypothetical protein BRADI_5g09601v3 [Brachypodium distachyon]|uniref:Uncharacterized protein n=1 Tax=Brachypodium distachyon TaxID=15368 RepID=A0A0Q3E879_BRADI|nr:hypothetical protein BRADI_5g09601v3 [Brachypodium distachyon]
MSRSFSLSLMKSLHFRKKIGKKVTQKLHRDQIGTLKYHGMRNIVRLPICYWLLHSQNDSDWCLALPPIDKMG